MTGRVAPEYRPHQPDRRLRSRESHRRSQPRRTACWRCWRSLSRRTRPGSAYPSSSRLRSGSCGPRGSGVLASRSSTNPSLTAALPMAAAPARLAAWCIGRAPRHGRPRPNRPGGRTAPDTRPPFYLARRIPSRPVIYRRNDAGCDGTRRKQGESRRPTTGGSDGRRAPDTTAARRRATGERADARAVAAGRDRAGVHPGRPLAPLPAFRHRRLA
jgi:hypothetical protein